MIEVSICFHVDNYVNCEQEVSEIIIRLLLEDKQVILHTKLDCATSRKIILRGIIPVDINSFVTIIRCGSGDVFRLLNIITFLRSI